MRIRITLRKQLGHQLREEDVETVAPDRLIVESLTEQVLCSTGEEVCSCGYGLRGSSLTTISRKSRYRQRSVLDTTLIWPSGSQSCTTMVLGPFAPLLNRESSLRV